MAEEQKVTRSLLDLINQQQVIQPPRQLSQEDKEQLAEAGTPFTINGIQYGDDKDFGPYFQFQIVVDGKPATFRLSSNENRDAFLSSLAEATNTGPISDVRLRAISTRGGNAFLTIEPAV